MVVDRMAKLDFGTYLFGTVWLDPYNCRHCLNTSRFYCKRCNGWWFVYDVQ